MIIETEGGGEVSVQLRLPGRLLSPFHILYLHLNDLKPRTGPNEIEVAIFMKEGKIVFNAYGGNEAINRPPYCLALFSTIPINLSGMKVGLDAFRPIHRELEEVVLNGLKFPVVLDPLEDLREDHLGHREICFVLYESVE